MRSRRQTIGNNCDGTALVEAAILLPLLCIIVFGVMEFSWLVSRRHIMQEGVAEAALYIAKSANPDSEATKDGAKLLATTGEVDGGPARVIGWSAENVQISYMTVPNPPGPFGDTSFRGGSVLESVTVSTSLVLPSLGLFKLIGVSAPEISVSDTERVIGSD